MIHKKHMDPWNERFSVRVFCDEQPDYTEEINYLIEMLSYVPIQNGVNSHFWMLLTPNDQDFKNWMFEKICWTNRGTADDITHFLSIKKAPYTFLAVTHNPFSIPIGENFRNIGFHGGVILTEAIRLGMDTAPIGCFTGYYDNPKIKKEFTKRVNQFAGESLKKYVGPPTDFAGKQTNQKIKLWEPMFYISLGKGERHTTNKSFESLLEYNGNQWQYTVGPKKGKPWNNVVKR